MITIDENYTDTNKMQGRFPFCIVLVSGNFQNLEITIKKNQEQTSQMTKQHGGIRATSHMAQGGVMPPYHVGIT